MTLANDEDIILIAPQADSPATFVEFKLIKQLHPGSTVPTYSLGRTVLDHIPEEARRFVVGYSVGQANEANCDVPCFLKTVTIIDSRSAGSARGVGCPDYYFDVLSPILKELGVSHVYVHTTGPESIAEAADSFSTSGTVVILGGDTSAHEFINCLRQVDVKAALRAHLVIIPTGSGNALASSIGLPTPLAALRRFFLASSSDFTPLNSFEVEFPNHQKSEALVVASWGFHASLVADADTPEMRAKFVDDPTQRFKEAARINLEMRHQDYVGRVRGTNKDLGDHHAYLLFTPVSHLEATFCISPKAVSTENKDLYMLEIKPFPSMADQQQELMEIMTKVYDNSKHIDDPRVIYERVVSDVAVDVADQPEVMRRWCVDGKIVVSPPGTVWIRAPTANSYKGWTLTILRA